VRAHARAWVAVAGEHLAGWCDDGDRFLVARRFEPVRAQRVLSLELSTADPSDYATLLAVKEAEGFSVVPLAAVATRAEELHALDAAATADVPATHPIDVFPYEDWLTETLGDPQLSREGSAVVPAGDEPVAYALLHVHPGKHVAANE
jgi:hypothetical protein